MKEGIASGGSLHHRRLKVVLVLTGLLTIVEAVGGVLTGSLALVADAGHMLTDVFGLGLALFAIWFGAKPPTPQRTFGYFRAEILAATLNAVLLFAISGYIFYEAVQRFRNPETIQAGPMLVVAVLGLIVNLVGAASLRRDSR